MKQTQAGFEVLYDGKNVNSRNAIDVYKHIERVARTCYRSEGSITDNSYEKFITNLRNRGHWAMLEHFIFNIEVTKDEFDDIFNVARMTPENSDLISRMSFISGLILPNDRYIVSASATALNYLWKCKCYAECDTEWDELPTLVRMCLFMKHLYPLLMSDPIPARVFDPYWSPEFDAHVQIHEFMVLANEDVYNMAPNSRALLDFVSIRFYVDIGVANEFVRHRPASFAQESSRYCNYSKDKYDSQLNTIEPFFFEEGSDLYNEWEAAMNDAQNHYMNMISLGANPEKARSVLPKSTKTELVMTARLWEWHHFLDMRTSAGAHPQAREVAKPLLAYMIAHYPFIFDDLKSRLEED